MVTRYRIHLENPHLAAGTINGRFAAVLRLAYEAADAGLLSPKLAAGIRRVNGAKKLGVRLGNWLTDEEARRLWQANNEMTYFNGQHESVQDILHHYDELGGPTTYPHYAAGWAVAALNMGMKSL